MGGVNNLGLGGNGGRDNGHGGPPDDEEPTINNYARANDYERPDSEFQLVNARNISITLFSGRNVQSNPYLPFNNAPRRLVLVQGQHGEELLKIFDDVEQFGDDKVNEQDLKQLATNSS